MTDTSTARPEVAQPPAIQAGATGLLRRHRSSLVITAAALVAVVVAVLLGSGRSSAVPLDPDNPGPGGAQAVARVLDRDGVDITVARGADELDRARIDADTTVVVVLPDRLGDSTVERLADDTADAAQVVVVGAGQGVVEALGVDGSPRRVGVGRGRDAGCGDPRFEGLSIKVDRAVTYPDGDCFGARTDGRYSALVATPEVTALDAPLLLFGADQALRNDQILRADNAAVALRLLGEQRHLVWYVPSLGDLVGSDGVSVRSLLPDYLLPGLWLVALALVGLVLWRARRLGPLATEPIPVVVRAIETTRSLGRLYRRSGDRGHAAESLRRAARARLAERLRLGSTAEPEALVREVARRTNRRADDLARLLGPGGDVPSTDHDLIALADALAELDDEVPRR